MLTCSNIESLQCVVKSFSDIFAKFGLKIDISKTKFMSILPENFSNNNNNFSDNNISNNNISDNIYDNNNISDNNISNNTSDNNNIYGSNNINDNNISDYTYSLSSSITSTRCRSSRRYSQFNDNNHVRKTGHFSVHNNNIIVSTTSATTTPTATTHILIITTILVISLTTTSVTITPIQTTTIGSNSNNITMLSIEDGKNVEEVELQFK